MLGGGAIGTLARILVSDALDAGAGQWPWGTFTANVAGALVLGYVFTRLMQGAAPLTLSVPLVCVGMLGGLTTFSTVALEIFLLGEAGRPELAGLYATVTVVVGLAGAAAGTVAAERHP